MYLCINNPISMIAIVSRQRFEVYCLNNKFDDNNLPQNAFFICIHNTAGENNKPYFKQDHPNVLRLWFDDCSEDRNGILLSGEPYTETAMTPEQAQQVYDFLVQQKEAGRGIGVVHCAAGVSRSGAVGVFAADFFGVDKREFKQLNQNIQPNPHILSLLNKILWQKHFQ